MCQTYPIRAGQRLTVDSQGAEGRVCGQALVPLTWLVIWDRLHEVSLQLTDAGVMPEQHLLRLIEILYRGKSRWKRRCGWGGGKDGGWRKRIIQGQKVHRGCPGREREGRRCVVERERLKEKKVRLFGVFLPFCATLVDLLIIKQAEAGLTWF